MHKILIAATLVLLCGCSLKPHNGETIKCMNGHLYNVIPGISYKIIPDSKGCKK